jgi:SAM-dependent methyltransferase
MIEVATGDQCAANDQRDLWDHIHEDHWSSRYSRRESAFARSVNAALPPRQRILEIGCGAGLDALFFQHMGHHVVAIDFSEFAIQQLSISNPNSGVDFRVHDMNSPLQFPDEYFDVVYSRLSLHYFTDRDTRRVFQEIRRVLRPQGCLHFMCKSINDPLYGKGSYLERDVYVLDGHLRHFFSKAYVRDVLACGAEFQLEQVRMRSEGVYGEPSAIIVVTARRPGPFIQLRLF